METASERGSIMIPIWISRWCNLRKRTWILDTNIWKEVHLKNHHFLVPNYNVKFWWGMYSVNCATTATTLSLSQGFYFVALDMFDPSCFCSCKSPKRIWWVTLHDVYTIPESSMYIYPRRNIVSSRLVKGAWNIGDLFCASEPIVDVQPYIIYACTNVPGYIYIYVDPHY